MKKINKLFLSLMFIFICSLACIYNVSAEETQENFRIEIEAETGNAGSGLWMSLEGFDKSKAINEKHSYYVKFVKNANEKPVLSETLDELTADSDEIYGDYYSVDLAHNAEKNIYKSLIYIEDDWYMVDGYTTAYIVKCVQNSETYKKECEVLNTPVTVEKPELPRLTQRYKFYLNGKDNQLSVFPYFPHLGELGSHEINVKIGVINDNELLKKISRNEAGSYETLISYAKTNDGTIYKFNDKEYYHIDTSGFNVVNGAYYYIYAYYTNTDGLYRNLDDVTVAMGDHNWLVNDVVWNFEETEWDKFISAFKNHETVQDYSEEEISFYNDDSKFIITLNSEESTFKTEFNYKDGIVSYVFDENKTEEDKFADLLFNTIALDVFAAKFDYKLEDFVEYLEKHEKYTIEKDGFEYESGKLYINEQTEISSVEIDGKYFKKLKFDIINGSKSFENRSNTVENPKTGINIQYGVLTLLAILTGAVYLLIRKYSKFPKHN